MFSRLPWRDFCRHENIICLCLLKNYIKTDRYENNPFIRVDPDSSDRYEHL